MSVSRKCLLALAVAAVALQTAQAVPSPYEGMIKGAFNFLRKGLDQVRSDFMPESLLERQKREAPYNQYYDNNAQGRFWVGDGIELKESTETNVWVKAINKNIEEQSIINNIAKDVLTTLIKIWGWLSLEFVLYGGANLFPDNL